jgi:hypothetical protein
MMCQDGETYPKVAILQVVMEVDIQVSVSALAERLLHRQLIGIGSPGGADSVVGRNEVELDATWGIIAVQNGQLVGDLSRREVAPGCGSRVGDDVKVSLDSEDGSNSDIAGGGGGDGGGGGGAIGLRLCHLFGNSKEGLTWLGGTTHGSWDAGKRVAASWMSDDRGHSDKAGKNGGATHDGRQFTEEA